MLELLLFLILFLILAAIYSTSIAGVIFTIRFLFFIPKNEVLLAREEENEER